MMTNREDVRKNKSRERKLNKGKEIGIVKRVLNYLFRLLKWIAKGKFYILSLLVLVTTSLYFIRILNNNIKIVSTFFLTIGLALIIWQMVFETRRFSEHKPNTIQNWIKNFPTLKPRNINIEVNSVAVVMMGSEINFSSS